MSDDVSVLTLQDVLDRLSIFETMNKNLQMWLEILSESNTDLTQRVNELEQLTDKAVKSAVDKVAAKSEIFEKYKTGFVKTNPHERDGSDFSDLELVFWASYILKDIPNRREKLNPTEGYKRVGRVSAMVKFFKQLALDKGAKSDEQAEKWARERSKQFIEFMLLNVTNQGEPLNFYQATSDWALNNYQGHFATWQFVKDVEDVPA